MKAFFAKLANNTKTFFGTIKRKMNFRDEANVLPVTKLRKVWFLIPAIVVFLALLLGTIYQVVPTVDKFMNIGIDFQGGSLLTVEMEGADMINENYDKNLGIITGVLTEKGLKLAVAQKSGDNAIIVRYTNVVNGVSYAGANRAEEMNNLNNDIKMEVQKRFKAEYTGDGINIPVPSVSMIGASASQRLLTTAILSVSIAILLILVYIIFRFDFFSGVSAVVGLLHDVLMMFAFTIIFRIQVNSSFVAAIITIVAYSINNTIIVFDRVRKAVKDNKKAGVNVSPFALADQSVTRTMSRSLFTTLTTMITVLALVIFGVASIKEFALPILFGLIAGLFSSTCIAPSLWATLREYYDKKKSQKPGAPSQPTDKGQKTEDKEDKPKAAKKPKSAPQTKRAKYKKKNAMSFK